MSSIFSKTTLARLYLILAFPFWFPRLLFCLILDFWRFNLQDWLPESRKTVVPEVTERPTLVVYQGGGGSNAPKMMDSRRQSMGLRLVSGDATAQSEAAPTNRHARRAN